MSFSCTAGGAPRSTFSAGYCLEQFLFCDITVKLGVHSHRAHRLVLASSCPSFASFLGSDPTCDSCDVSSLCESKRLSDELGKFLLPTLRVIYSESEVARSDREAPTVAAKDGSELGRAESGEPVESQEKPQSTGVSLSQQGTCIELAPTEALGTIYLLDIFGAKSLAWKVAHYLCDAAHSDPRFRWRTVLHVITEHVDFVQRYVEFAAYGAPQDTSSTATLLERLASFVAQDRSDLSLLFPSSSQYSVLRSLEQLLRACGAKIIDEMKFPLESNGENETAAVAQLGALAEESDVALRAARLVTYVFTLQFFACSDEKDNLNVRQALIKNFLRGFIAFFRIGADSAADVLSTLLWLESDKRTHAAEVLFFSSVMQSLFERWEAKPLLSDSSQSFFPDDLLLPLMSLSIWFRDESTYQGLLSIVSSTAIVGSKDWALLSRVAQLHWALRAQEEYKRETGRPERKRKRSSRETDDHVALSHDRNENENLSVESMEEKPLFTSSISLPESPQSIAEDLCAIVHQFEAAEADHVKCEGMPTPGQVDNTNSGSQCKKKLPRSSSSSPSASSALLRQVLRVLQRCHLRPQETSAEHVQQRIEALDQQLSSIACTIENVRLNAKRAEQRMANEFDRVNRTVRQCCEDLAQLDARRHKWQCELNELKQRATEL